MICYIGELAMLSNLYNQTFTIINQIPTSQTNGKKCKWVKHTLRQCDKVCGIYDKTSGAMFLSDTTYTVYTRSWQNYRPPTWIDGGYYTLSDNVKQDYFTAAGGDLVIFSNINDPVPTDGEEYDALIEKYAKMGGTVSDVEEYINYKPDGAPWRTNHIEIIKR